MGSPGTPKQPASGEPTRPPRPTRTENASPSELESTRQELREAREQQAAVAATLQTVSQSRFELQPVLDAVIEHAVRLCHAEWGFLDRLEGDTQQRVAVSSGAPDDEGRALLGKQNEISHWNFGRAILERRPIALRTEDVVHEPDAPSWTRAWLERHPNLRSGLGVPLIAPAGPIGVLGLWGLSDRLFSQSEIALVESFAAQAVIAIENGRLLTETNEALEQQTATSDVLTAINRSAFDLDTVLGTVLDRSLVLCGADHGMVVRRNDDTFATVAYRGTSKEVGEYIASRREGGLLRGYILGPGDAEAIEQRHTVHLSGLDPEQLPKGGFTYATGSRSRLSVPLVRGDEVIGLVVLARADPAGFTPRQISLIETFAQQAVIAIENVRLFNETKEALEQQTAVAEVLQTISRSTFDLQPVLDVVLDNAVQLVGADIGWLARADGAHFKTVAYSRAFPEAVRTELARSFGFLPEAGVPIGPQSGVMGLTLSEARTIHVADMTHDERLRHSLVVRLTDSRTALGIPMLKEGRAIGAIVLTRYVVRPFSKREIELVQTFADQAAIAIENVRLFNETKEALEQQTATGEVLRVISRSTFDLQSVLDTVVENAVRLCGAHRGVLWRLEEDGYRMAAHWGSFGPGELEAFGAMNQRPGEANTVVTRAAAACRPVQVEDVTGDPNNTVQSSGRAPTRLGVPLLREGAPIGVLTLTRMEVKLFNHKEIGIVTTFADQAVIAIENARLIGEIREKSRQLEAASRHKSEFLANMSHELRTPLNAIIGFSDVLEQRMFGQLNDQQAEYVRDIAGSGRHLLGLVNEILDLAKVEAGRMDLELSEFALADTISGALAFVRERAAGQRIELAAALPDDLGTVVADERKIRQVLLNLLSNAVKFTPDGGQVTLRAERQADKVHIAVQDTGIGIAAADLPRVFEEFRQVGTASERSREGTGLGLTLAKRFIELHGGTIEVESELGAGTTFSFAIPVAQASAVPA